MCSSVSGDQIGAKNPEPFQMVDVQMREQQMDRRRRVLASSIAEGSCPVPASRTTRVPSASRTSTHEVFPP